MAELMFAMPILPGKTETAREWFKAMEGRRNESDAADARHGIKKEAWFIQSSPQGDFLLGYLEGEDLDKSVSAFSTDQDPFVVWLREKYKEITGIDMSQQQDTPPPEQVWRHGY